MCRLAALALLFLAAPVAKSQSAFDEYQLDRTVTLPGAGGVCAALPDGRWVALNMADVYLETAARSGAFEFFGSLQDAVMPSYGAAFLRLSPNGTQLAVGNNGFGPGAEIGIFELPAERGGVIPVKWYEVQHFDAAWFSDDWLAVTSGFDETVVQVLDLTDPENPTLTDVIDHIGGASAGIAFDSAGRLYTGNGFAIEGPSETGWVKAFAFSDWTAALATAEPLDFEAQGTLIVDLLSAAALGFDEEGNLHVGGGDFGSSDQDFAAVVRSAAVEAALDGQGPADPDDPSQVRKLDPDAGNPFNFYDAGFNDISGELFIRELDTVYLYTATYPHAAAVAEYVQGGAVNVDFLNGLPLNDPQGALGRPTVDTTGNGLGIPIDEIVPAVPVYAPFRSFELVGIGAGGHLTLRFNHPVEDHPCHPFGIDLVIFGNSFHVLGGGEPWLNGDPNDTFLSAAMFTEPAVVSVSQDGQEWFTFENGPFADSFAATLGRLYDPSNPDAEIGEWNEWWAGPTDPTVPLDPTLVPGDFNGLSVADVAEFYGDSAGGTGFDLADVGLSWIRYVRIENGGFGVPEVDAIAEVAAVVGSIADLTGDCAVNAADLAQVLGNWGPCANVQECPADLDGSGGVGPEDLAVVLGNWG